MVQLSADRALNSFFNCEIFIFTMVANVVVGDIRCFLSTLYTILSSKKWLQILTQIIKFVYKRLFTNSPPSLTWPCKSSRLLVLGLPLRLLQVFSTTVLLQEHAIYIAHFISKFGKLLWSMDDNISRQHFTVDQVFDGATDAIDGAFAMVGFAIMPFLGHIFWKIIKKLNTNLERNWAAYLSLTM